MFSATARSCRSTLMAVIYTDVPSKKDVPGVKTLEHDIHALEKAIWNYSGQRYLGIFTTDDDGNVATTFAKYAEFHLNTETGYAGKAPGKFNEPLLELLRSNGTTHVLIVGMEVAAIARGAKENGFETCIFLPATRGSTEELKDSGVLLAENEEQLVGEFLSKIPLVNANKCPSCVWADQLPYWCTYKRSEFLWRTTMRLSIAVKAVMARGFDGEGDPLTRGGISRQGHWRCTDVEKVALLDAISAAESAGIPTGDAGYIYAFTPNRRKDTHWYMNDIYFASLRQQEADELKSEIAALKARIAQLERPPSPSFYVSSDGGTP